MPLLPPVTMMTFPLRSGTSSSVNLVVGGKVSLTRLPTEPSTAIQRRKEGKNLREYLLLIRGCGGISIGASRRECRSQRHPATRQVGIWNLSTNNDHARVNVSESLSLIFQASSHTQRNLGSRMFGHSASGFGFIREYRDLGAVVVRVER